MFIVLIFILFLCTCDVIQHHELITVHREIDTDFLNFYVLGK